MRKDNKVLENDTSEIILGAAEGTNYEIEDAITMRNLIVCKSQDLPLKPDRDRLTVYFVYDKMELHVYQSLYTDPFCIVKSLNPDRSYLTDRMLYITMDGNVYTYSSYKVIRLAQISDPSQLTILEACGSIYFMNAESRYLDLQTRTLVLPFQNGSYQLQLSLPKDLSIDEETVIRFNEATNQFYVAGKEYQFEDKLNNLYKYSGLNSHTVINEVDNHNFKSYVRISEYPGNTIKALHDGLFVSTLDLVTQEDYIRALRYWNQYKLIVDDYIAKLIPIIEQATEDVSTEAIRNKILETLEAYEPDILNLIADYEDYGDRITRIEQTLESGSSNLGQAKQEIIDYLNNAFAGGTWQPVSEPVPGPEDNLDSEVVSEILSIYRSSILSLRETDDGSFIDTTGDDPDDAIQNATETLPGLSLNETAVQRHIMSVYAGIEATLESL